jgi:cytochrome c oxidase subunit III
MTFSAFISAVIVRRGLGTDWQHLPLPRVFWLNTGVLIVSSIVLDLARRQLRNNNRIAFNWLWLVGMLLGCGFLVGQIVGWRELVQHGFYMQGNISSSFFYILTWAHATHAIAGLIALVYVTVQAFAFRLGPAKRTVISVSLVFWHFLDILWLALMALFLAWF